MPECTDIERELLDVLASEDRFRGINEIRARLAISKVTPELREALIDSTARFMHWHDRKNALWKQFHALGFPGGDSEAFDEFWNSIMDEAKRRNQPTEASTK